ncbi:hypothetical protein AWH56_020680 [Anaerobacillus isosaccharinicus]|uniref:Uncharacterized protein n=1 Tax=Anaerobacillus isosaccharinicus TaxID=1532552 RepID=A0A1S2MD19_9BACI|nr:hypothetical protein [Anaerobacillus isosaccharinicus]MBA5586677.1 hypothetical protein [Anaerobacillus isosaccharinicus]QOY35092.1 hypothetical protein AWH56_020680 [Anaerobacillus isosaccharinicus]
MQNEHEFIDKLKSSPDFEPRKEFVQKAKNELLREARRMEVKNKVKKISVFSASIAITTLLLVWVSVFGGKQVIIDTVASILNEENSEVIEKAPDQNTVLLENREIAKMFLEEKGYDVVSYDGASDAYTLTQEKLVEIPFMQQWWVQSVIPEEFFGKSIDTELFTVQGHPLDHSLGSNSLGLTGVSILIVDGTPIGGTSWPLTIEPVYTGVHSLDGKTIEELYDTDYLTWHEDWAKKYYQVTSIVDEPIEIETELLAKTEIIFSYLETFNWSELANYVHPEKGVFFSFYADAGSPFAQEVAFTKDALRELEGTETFVLGYDMGDYKFEFPINEYVTTFLINHSQRWDGKNSTESEYEVITYNDSVVDSGGIINTIPEYFPDAKYVEYYSPRPSEELWHQWQALRFIYEEYDSQWYLIGIARDVHSP